MYLSCIMYHVSCMCVRYAVLQCQAAPRCMSTVPCPCRRFLSKQPRHIDTTPSLHPTRLSLGTHHLPICQAPPPHSVPAAARPVPSPGPVRHSRCPVQLRFTRFAQQRPTGCRNPGIASLSLSLARALLVLRNPILWGFFLQKQRFPPSPILPRDCPG